MPPTGWKLLDTAIANEITFDAAKKLPYYIIIIINWCMSMMHLEDALLKSLTMQVERTPLEPTQDLQELIDESKYDDEWV